MRFFRRKVQRKTTAHMAAAIIMALCLSAFSLFGSSKGADADNGSNDEAYWTAFDVSLTENDIPVYNGTNVIPKTINAENYADYFAWEHAQDNGGGEYLEWLADFCVNVAGPQAVEMLLRIPCFREAADKGLLSKYIVLRLTYDDVNQFGAMTEATFLEKNGNITHGKGAPIYNLAYILLINTGQQDYGLRNSPEKIRELQDTMVHEMMHAFMYDYTRNAMIGTDKDGYRPKDFSETLPDWFSEGTAISVAAGYNQSRSAILENFFMGEDYSQEEILEIYGDRYRMAEAQTFMFDSFTEEDWKFLEQEYGSRDILPTDLTLEENTYGISYAGTMFLYYMAAETLGLEPIDENGALNMNAMLEGLDFILRSLHNGYSLDQVIARISADKATGLSVYSDTADFEKHFLHGADEPGMVFTQKLLFYFESRITDHNVYMPSGSVLPGYRTRSTDFMDSKVHQAPEVFSLVASPRTNRYDELFAVSTVRPSALALGGTRSVSYADEPALSAASAAEKDAIYTGDSICLVDFAAGQEYTSRNDWIIVSEDDLYRINGSSGIEMTVYDALSADYQGGFISESDDGKTVFFLIYKDALHGEFAAASFEGNLSICRFQANLSEYSDNGPTVIQFLLEDGNSADYYITENEQNYVSVNGGSFHPVYELEESDAAEALTEMINEEWLPDLR